MYYEIRFEQPVLEKLFGEVKTIPQQREIIQEEINDVDDV